MLHCGENLIDGVTVIVARKRIRRINVRVKGDGVVCLSIPKWWSALKEGEAFLRAKWGWVVQARTKILRSVEIEPPVDETAKRALNETLERLMDDWTSRLNELGVDWKLRQMRTLWGSCHFRKRHITYNTELARVPPELIEYVVVHELTHLKAHDHGPRFKSLMDERLPQWRNLRLRLNRREWQPKDVPVIATVQPKLTQGEFWPT